MSLPRLLYTAIDNPRDLPALMEGILRTPPSAPIMIEVQFKGKVATLYVAKIEREG